MVAWTRRNDPGSANHPTAPLWRALSTDLGGTVVPVAALFAWLKGEPTEVDGWQADLSRHSEGRITARRPKPLPAAELRLVFEP